LFMEAFMFIIFCNPTIVACFLSFNSFIIFVNKIKSALLFVNKGYLLKWGIITSVRLAKDCT
jgi:hypothetical protein